MLYDIIYIYYLFFLPSPFTKMKCNAILQYNIFVKIRKSLVTMFFCITMHSGNMCGMVIVIGFKRVPFAGNRRLLYLLKDV